MTEWREALLAKHKPTVWPAIDCGDGWRAPVEALYAYVERNPCMIIDQIKEKFGGLRLYVGHDHECECTDEKVRRQYDTVNGMEAVANFLCERCGKTDTVALRGGGWIRNLCDECHGSSETLEQYRARREEENANGSVNQR